MKKILFLFVVTFTYLSMNVVNAASLTDKVKKLPVLQRSYAKVINTVSEANVSVYALKESVNTSVSLESVVMQSKDADIEQTVTVSSSVSPVYNFGSGFFIDQKGTILTSYHVIADADKVFVVLEDGTEFETVLKSFDTATDIAILHIADAGSRKFNFVEFGNSAKLLVGDQVFSLGNQLGMGLSASVGIISAINRLLPNYTTDLNFLQTNLMINSGDSGGAVYNMNGEVVAVNFGFVSDVADSNVGISVAVPAKSATKIVKALQDIKQIEHGKIGIAYQAVNAETAKQIKLPTLNKSGKYGGVLVGEVKAGSAAEKAGIMVGDVIVALDGVSITKENTLGDIICAYSVGQVVDLKVFRDGKMLDIKLTLAESGSSLGHQSTLKHYTKQEPKANTSVGLYLIPVTPELRKVYNISQDAPDGLIVGAESNVKIKEEDVLRVGDLIVSADDISTITIDQFESAMKQLKDKSKKFSMMRIFRRNTTFLEPVEIF